MATPTFTATGTKATTAVSLPKSVFSIEVTSHQLLRMHILLTEQIHAQT